MFSVDFFQTSDSRLKANPTGQAYFDTCLYAQKVTTNAFNRAQKESLIGACNIWVLAFQGLENELQKQKASKGKGKQKASVQNVSF